MYDRFKDTALYPPIKAYDKFMLKVSDVHTVAVAQYGNPKGKPVLFVHGGPGGGTDPAVPSLFVHNVRYEIIMFA
jgi:proline iminopeptidase